MKVKELIEALNQLENKELEIFTQKHEVFGNIGNTFGIIKDNYSSFGNLIDCYIITDRIEDI